MLMTPPDDTTPLIPVEKAKTKPDDLWLVYLVDSVEAGEISTSEAFVLLLATDAFTNAPSAP